MAMGYVHLEIDTSQRPKVLGNTSGDIIEIERNNSGTIIFFSDGMGSGINANLAATMHISRLKTLINSGLSLRKAISKVVKTLNEAPSKSLPYAVFTIAKILNNGTATIITYEMPAPIFISRRFASELQFHKININGITLLETNCTIKKNEAIVLVSDGITQAGMDKKNNTGWGNKNLVEFINSQLADREVNLKELPKLIKNQAENHWGEKVNDDLSALIGIGRTSQIVNILSGPPGNQTNDKKIVEEFLSNDGFKIICGATTAKIAANILEKDLFIEKYSDDELTPPFFELEGIDIVSEGIVTLNQIYNVYDEDSNKLNKKSSVNEILSLLSIADRVNFIVGTSYNPANSDIAFKQRGLLNRNKIIPILVEKLKNDEKTVTIKYF